MDETFFVVPAASRRRAKRGQPSPADSPSLQNLIGQTKRTDNKGTPTFAPFPPGAIFDSPSAVSRALAWPSLQETRAAAANGDEGQVAIASPTGADASHAGEPSASASADSSSSSISSSSSSSSHALGDAAGTRSSSSLLARPFPTGNRLLPPPSPSPHLWTEPSPLPPALPSSSSSAHQPLDSLQSGSARWTMEFSLSPGFGAGAVAAAPRPPVAAPQPPSIGGAGWTLPAAIRTSSAVPEAPGQRLRSSEAARAWLAPDASSDYSPPRAAAYQDADRAGSVATPSSSSAGSHRSSVQQSVRASASSSRAYGSAAAARDDQGRATTSAQSRRGDLPRRAHDIEDLDDLEEDQDDDGGDGDYERRRHPHDDDDDDDHVDDSDPDDLEIPEDVSAAGKKWSSEEDQRLRDAVEVYGTVDWRMVSDAVGNGRTTKSVRARWAKLSTGVAQRQVTSNRKSRGVWTAADDALLGRLVDEHGGPDSAKWSLIARSLGSRDGKQCRDRWYNHVDPRINRSHWTEEEDDVLFAAKVVLGNKWSDIARIINHRTENMVKNRYNSRARAQWLARKAQEGFASEAAFASRSDLDGLVRRVHHLAVVRAARARGEEVTTAVLAAADAAADAASRELAALVNTHGRDDRHSGPLRWTAPSSTPWSSAPTSTYDARPRAPVPEAVSAAPPLVITMSSAPAAPVAAAAAVFTAPTAPLVGSSRAPAAVASAAASSSSSAPAVSEGPAVRAEAASDSTTALIAIARETLRKKAAALGVPEPQLSDQEVLLAVSVAMQQSMGRSALLQPRDAPSSSPSAPNDTLVAAPSTAAVRPDPRALSDPPASAIRSAARAPAAPLVPVSAVLEATLDPAHGRAADFLRAGQAWLLESDWQGAGVGEPFAGIPAGLLVEVAERSAALFTGVAYTARHWPRTALHAGGQRPNSISPVGSPVAGNSSTRSSAQALLGASAASSTLTATQASSTLASLAFRWSAEERRVACSAASMFSHLALASDSADVSTLDLRSRALWVRILVQILLAAHAFAESSSKVRPDVVPQPSTPGRDTYMRARALRVARFMLSEVYSHRSLLRISQRLIADLLSGLPSQLAAGSSSSRAPLDTDGDDEMRALLSTSAALDRTEGLRSSLAGLGAVLPCDLVDADHAAFRDPRLGATVDEADARSRGEESAGSSTPPLARDRTAAPRSGKGKARAATDAHPRRPTIDVAPVSSTTRAAPQSNAPGALLWHDVVAMPASLWSEEDDLGDARAQSGSPSMGALDIVEEEEDDDDDSGLRRLAASFRRAGALNAVTSDHASLLSSPEDEIILQRATELASGAAWPVKQEPPPSGARQEHSTMTRSRGPPAPAHGRTHGARWPPEEQAEVTDAWVPPSLDASARTSSLQQMLLSTGSDLPSHDHLGLETSRASQPSVPMVAQHAARQDGSVGRRQHELFPAGSAAAGFAGHHSTAPDSSPPSGERRGAIARAWTAADRMPSSHLGRSGRTGLSLPPVSDAILNSPSLGASLPIPSPTATSPRGGDPSGVGLGWLAMPPPPHFDSPDAGRGGSFRFQSRGVGTPLLPTPGSAAARALQSAADLFAGFTGSRDSSFGLEPARAPVSSAALVDSQRNDAEGSATPGIVQSLRHMSLQHDTGDEAMLPPPLLSDAVLVGTSSPVDPMGGVIEGDDGSNSDGDERLRRGGGQMGGLWPDSLDDEPHSRRRFAP